MSLSNEEVLDLTVKRLWPAFQAERSRLDQIDLWYRWKNEDITIPAGATKEMKALIELAKTPWLGLVVTGVAQSMWVDGYRSPDSRDDLAPWELFRRNGLQSGQGAIHRAMLGYGRSYGTTLPGLDPLTGEATAVMRGVSPRKMLAFWVDPVEDEWPMYALRAEPRGTYWDIRVYDDTSVYSLTTNVDPGEAVQMRWVKTEVHGVGVCPVVQFSNLLDLEGRTDGEVEPLIPLAKRINKTTYDRLLIQHFNSWKVRWATGLAKPDEDEAENLRIRLRQDSLLINESPDARFGTLDETSMDGVISAYETDIKTLAAASQTAVHALTGDMINVSAEGLAASKAEAEAKKHERQMSAGGTWEKWLRLGSHVAGDEVSATDYLAQVSWADTSVRSLATAADALGKMATMLGVPPRALWSRIPGVTKTDVEEWTVMADQGDAFSQLSSILDRQATQPVA